MKVLVSFGRNWERLKVYLGAFGSLRSDFWDGAGKEHPWGLLSENLRNLPTCPYPLSPPLTPGRFLGFFNASLTAASRASKVLALETLPLIKTVGVPLTPIWAPSLISWLILATILRSLMSFSNLSRSKPSSRAICRNFWSLRVSIFSNKRS